MSDLIIREMMDDDKEELVAIARIAWEPVYEHRRQVLGDELFGLLYENWRESKSGEIHRALEREHVWVAEQDGQPVGFVTYSCPENKVGRVGNNAVHPNYQGRGIASRLYQQMLDDMRAKGMRAARVYTGGDPAHAPARRAYEKAGFDMALPTIDYFRFL